MAKHWIAQVGMHGYMPETSCVCRTKGEAVDTLVNIGELPKYGNVAKGLRKYGSADANNEPHNLWYYSVEPCDCDEPWIHDDQLTEEQWKDELSY